jgi:hypothetical protein
MLTSRKEQGGSRVSLAQIDTVANYCIHGSESYSSQGEPGILRSSPIPPPLLSLPSAEPGTDPAKKVSPQGLLVLAFPPLNKQSRGTSSASPRSRLYNMGIPGVRPSSSFFCSYFRSCSGEARHTPEASGASEDRMATRIEELRPARRRAAGERHPRLDALMRCGYTGSGASCDARQQASPWNGPRLIGIPPEHLNRRRSL